ncbi:MAG: hypothetical protein U0531_10280 [Dehalococcoidia bacterium]
MSCAIGNLPVGAGVTVLVTVRPLQPGPLTNSARISGRAQVDPNTANETASATVQAP